MKKVDNIKLILDIDVSEDIQNRFPSEMDLAEYIIGQLTIGEVGNCDIFLAKEGMDGKIVKMSHAM